jgi:toxin CptA
MRASAFLIALVAVSVMGFANQRGGTCTVAAFKEVVFERRYKRLIALFEASLWAGAGFLLLDAAGLLTTVPANYAAGARQVAGGVLFGIGAFLNGSCIFGSVARLGSGELSYLAMPFEFYLGGVAVAHLPVPAQLDEGSPLVAASAWLLAPIIVVILARLYAHVRQMRQTTRTLWNHIWSPHVATTIIGIAFVVTTGAQQSWTYSDVLSDLAHGVTTGLPRKALLGVALLIGAFLGGVSAGRFKVAPPNVAEIGRHLAGGILMGAAALLIPGGNTGLALVGLPLLFPYAWLAFISICVTIYVALRLRVRSRTAVSVRSAEKAARNSGTRSGEMN